MPFSWKKKTRCTRFSQLVADHLQSPKRGGSLVVETGFPTSLIDLYVRNRSRFRKPPVKKQRENDSQISLSTSTTTSFSSGSLLDPNNFSSGASDCIEIDEIIEEDIVVDGSVESGKIEIENFTNLEVEKRGEMAKLNPVLVVALKVLFMVVLALGTKKFTVGITLSAFVLFFLESVVKPLFVRSSSISPTVDSETQSESGFCETEKIERSKENTTLVVCSEVLEIEEVESKEEVRSEKESDEVRTQVVMEIRHKVSRRAILKSRMKKLVPKKLHKSSMGSKGERSCGLKEEETVKCAQDIQPLLICSESSDSKGEILCVLKQEQDKIVETEGRSSSSSLTLSNEIGCNDKDLGRGIQQNSGYLVLCLIVLLGLIGGRILALVLALSWCLVLKKSQWRNVKFPIS